MTTIGERIREARSRAGMTQRTLAELVGVSASAVTQWESGSTKGLKPDNLFSVADALRVSPRWLAIGRNDTIAQGQQLEEPQPAYSSGPGPQQQLLELWLRANDITRRKILRIAQILME